MRGNELVEGVLKEWENIVNRVARDTVGEKVIVCGRSVRWWDDEIKAKIEQRRQLYKRMVRGQEGLWDEYNKLRREVKHLVMEKKLNVWNGVVEKANADFEANKKEFWSFVGRRTKGRKGGVEALRNDSGVSVTSTRGKLKVLQSHYQCLGSCSVDDAFDDNWKQEVDSKVNECHRCSVEHDDPVLDELQEIVRCVRKLKIGLVGDLLKYGGSGMIHLLYIQAFRGKELVPPKWREGLIVKKGDKDDPGNYRGIIY